MVSVAMRIGQDTSGVDKVFVGMAVLNAFGEGASVIREVSRAFPKVVECADYALLAAMGMLLSGSNGPCGFTSNPLRPASAIASAQA